MKDSQDEYPLPIEGELLSEYFWRGYSAGRQFNVDISGFNKQLSAEGGTKKTRDQYDWDRGFAVGSRAHNPTP